MNRVDSNKLDKIERFKLIIAYHWLEDIEMN